MAHKILVMNGAALNKKYGAPGFKMVRTAIDGLVAADQARGLVTQLVDISDATQMKKFKGKAVTKATDERQCKDAVDAIYTSGKPHYLVLLDGPDVIPHLKLNNPTPADKDQTVPSDLPYASDAAFTKRDVPHYAALTRVVGRIPGITGDKDPAFLVSQLKAAANFKCGKREDFLPGFVISAKVWDKSTALSAQNIFGDDKIQECPPTGTPAVGKLLSPLCHFINCHGAAANPQFFGQNGHDYPVAMTSGDVATGAKRNSIVAAECCYGAELYDPSYLAGQTLPISISYLKAGAAAYVGSTNIAYGPAEGNGAADLLTQYFLINTLGGASFGRAFLEARQKFVLGQKMEDPVNLKTLAQFILLADPSLQACPSTEPATTAASDDIDHSAARDTRRVFLSVAGKAAADSSGFPGKKISSPPKTLQALVERIAKKRGFPTDAKHREAFQVVGGADYGKEMKARGVEQKVIVIVDPQPMNGKTNGKTNGKKHAKPGVNGEEGAMPPTDMVRILVAHAQDDRIVEVAEYLRR